MLSSPSLFSKFSSKVLLFNASPRPHGNTAKILESIKKGAESTGAQAKLVNLYKLNFKGCSSCLSCKKKNSPAGCVLKDDLSKYLKETYECNGIAIGSPVYCGNFASGYYALFERLMYSNRRYELPPNKIKFGKRINTALVFTMGYDEAKSVAEYSDQIKRNKHMFEETIGPCTVIKGVKQLITHDFSPYDMGSLDKKSMEQWMKEQDPIVLKQAFDLGVKLATQKP